MYLFRILSAALVDVMRIVNVIESAVWTNFCLLRFHYVKFSETSSFTFYEHN